MSANPVPFRRFRMRTQVRAEETIVCCSGRLTSEHSEEFKDEVHKLIQGAKAVIVDFTQVEHMDSSGVGAVVRIYVSAMKEQCDLRLVNFNQRIRDLLGLTGLLKIFGDCGKYMIRMP